MVYLPCRWQSAQKKARWHAMQLSFEVETAASMWIERHAPVWFEGAVVLWHRTQTPVSWQTRHRSRSQDAAVPCSRTLHRPVWSRGAESRWHHPQASEP
jgi:hypothetical protein